jgi:hypothetical protein
MKRNYSHMKQKRNFFALNRRAVIVLVLLVIVAASITVIMWRNHTEAVSVVEQPPVGAAVPSQFTFDKSGAPDWWQGATRKTDMALFHAHDCFVSVQYKTGTIAADKEKIQKDQADLVSRGYTITPGTSQTLTLQTKSGSKQYDLNQSVVTSPAGADTVKGGQEFGYLPLTNGYVFVEGYCDTSEQLTATIPALQAITFDETQ